tara:strand:- start:253 stop:429 length:177 start_codon:yes stop_codon:yes gene_type:complete
MKRIYKIGFDDFYVVRVGIHGYARPWFAVRQKPFISRFIPQNINLSSINNGFYIIRRI